MFSALIYTFFFEPWCLSWSSVSFLKSLNLSFEEKTAGLALFWFWGVKGIGGKGLCYMEWLLFPTGVARDV